MAKVLIVYHSNTGNTEKMARSVLEGAKSVLGTEVTMKRASDATADDLVACDVVAFGSPANLGYMAGVLKDFFDRLYRLWQQKATEKCYVTFGSAGGGGGDALVSIDHLLERNFKQFRKLTEGVVAARQPSPEVLNQCRELGKKLATAA